MGHGPPESQDPFHIVLEPGPVLLTEGLGTNQKTTEILHELPVGADIVLLIVSVSCWNSSL